MCRFHYEDLNAAWKETLKYCFRTSDRFSLITRILSKKKGNAVYAHDKALTALEPFLIERKVGVKSWPGTITKGTDYVMDLYHARKYRKSVTDLPNFFAPNESGQPEDICFYRNGTVWVATVSHEQIAFASNLTKEDKAFFDRMGVRYDERMNDSF